MLSQDGRELKKGGMIIKFKEGRPAYEDAIAELSSLYALPLLKWSEGLAAACE
jgi:hypothetical protein